MKKISNLTHSAELLGINDTTDFTIERAFNRLRQNAVLKRYLKNILNSEPELERIASRSYAHKNGFDKFLLFYAGRANPSIRLHIWNKQLYTEYPDAHNHPWYFRSHILAGSLTNIQFEESSTSWTNNDRKVHKYKIGLMPRSFDGHSDEYIGECWLSEISRIEISAGQEYSCSPETIHQNIVGQNSGCISLFLQMPFAYEASSAFRQKPMPGAQNVKVKMFDSEEVAEKLKAVTCVL